MITKLASVALALLVTCAALAGCSTAATSVDSAQQENRSYMSKVNEVMSELGDDLESFVGAVSRNDVVNMRTQAKNAYRVLDSLESIEAPESLSDVRQKYIDGTAKLREALDGYIELYTEAESGVLDQSSYADRLAKVQSLYDEGVGLLKQADETASQK